MVFIQHVFAYDTWADCSVKFFLGTPCSQMAFHHYVIAYVSSGHSPGHIMPHTFLGMCCYKGLPMSSCTTLFAADYFFLSSMYTLMLLQVTTSYKSCSTFFADKLFSSSMCLHTTLKLIAKLYRGPGRSTIAWPLSTAVHTLHPACLGELTWGRLLSR